MRFVVCERIWHSFDVPHCHLLLMMGFDCPLAFHHKKGEYIFDLREHFVLFSGGEHFILLVRACGVVYIVSRCFTLYITFLALATFVFILLSIFMLGGVYFLFICFLFQNAC